ncbi:DUF7511 domain-containing protein [Natronococcus occultus]|uniref:DUF7511 domain-containing protein n=1 Tax=Natronococcus occultus SP4 TaxID=694430 RepID=L0JW03_9EURY|nr:hypothetical protein [Natronococcus occultus]AGB37207.1 hypothetical protein Natoc_1395 [Natronococcus occultus SP4]
MGGRSTEDVPNRNRSTDSESSTPLLDAAVVADEGGDDRRTVSPANCPDERKPTVWLSANASAFVDLEEWR